jgi:competence protein ComEA
MPRAWKRCRLAGAETASIDSAQRHSLTPSERNALLFFAVVALLGAGVRLSRVREDESAPAAARAALDHQIAAVESARSGRIARAGRPRRSTPFDAPIALNAPIAPNGRTPLLDLDTAPAESLIRLPRIGPTLAKRIVADRDSLGPFGSLEGFQRVRGVGPAMAKALGDYVTFSGTPRPSRVDTRVRTHRRESSHEPRRAGAPR